jgi:hypothetical protein
LDSITVYEMPGIVSPPVLRAASGVGGGVGLPGAQAAGPQRHLQFQAHVGVVEAVAEEVLEFADPVAHGLRVDEEQGGDLGRVAAGLQPGEQRVGEPVALLGAEVGERREDGTGVGGLPGPGVLGDAAFDLGHHLPDDLGEVRIESRDDVVRQEIPEPGRARTARDMCRHYSLHSQC